MKQDMLIFIGIFVFGLLMSAHYVMLHNVDLSWNVKHLDLEDTNGLVTQDVSQMYSRAILYFYIEPILWLLTGFGYVKLWRKKE